MDPESLTGAMGPTSGLVPRLSQLAHSAVAQQRHPPDGSTRWISRNSSGSPMGYLEKYLGIVQESQNHRIC